MREKQWRFNSKNNEEIYFAQYSNFYTKKCFYFTKKIDFKKVWLFNIFSMSVLYRKMITKMRSGFFALFSPQNNHCALTSYIPLCGNVLLEQL